MPRFILLTVFLFLDLLPPGQLAGAEPTGARNAVPFVVGPHPSVWRFTGPPQSLPFARSARSQAVWDADGCWRECQTYCAWNLNACLAQDTQGVCLAYTDACDRYCQRTCRTQGGPFLPFD